MAHFEDREDVRKVIGIHLESMGHSVVAVATNLREALETIDQIASGGIEVDAIILDGNLKQGANDNQDARDIVAYAKSKGVTVPIIGFASESLTKRGIAVDHDPTKQDIPGLLKIIGDL